MTRLVKIIHIPCGEQFHVGTNFSLRNYTISFIVLVFSLDVSDFILSCSSFNASSLCALPILFWCDLCFRCFIALLLHVSLSLSFPLSLCQFLWFLPGVVHLHLLLACPLGSSFGFAVAVWFVLGFVFLVGFFLDSFLPVLLLPAFFLLVAFSLPTFRSLRFLLCQ